MPSSCNDDHDETEGGDVAGYNRRAWDRQVDQGNRWTVPVDTQRIAAARRGDWSIVLTPERAVPRTWFPPLANRRVLGLACGGGQQAAILAAAGAHVTVLDNSPRQLEQDQAVARREGLEITTVLGDMRDLSQFDDRSFDVVVNPCSVSFVPNVSVVFREVARVLEDQGVFMGGFINPAWFVFDEAGKEQGRLEVRHVLPYADRTHLSRDEIAKILTAEEPLIFSHSLEELLTGQMRVGLSIVDFYEDRPSGEIISRYMPSYFATLATKTDR